MHRRKLLMSVLVILVASPCLILAQESEGLPDLTQFCTPETFTQYDRYILKNCPDEGAFVAVQRVAAPYIRDRQWDQAAEVFKRYQPLFPAMAGRFEKIIDLLLAPEEGLMVTNLGSDINSSASDFLAVPTADGRALYFNGYKRTGGKGKEDIYFTQLIDGIWQQAVNLDSINSEDNEDVLAISTDGNQLILYGAYGEHFGRGDIYFADKTASSWGKIQHFPSPINSVYFESCATLSSDGKAIIFASDRPGGIGEFHKKQETYHGSQVGNIDIYACVKTDTGWSALINLGPTINTPYAEYTPFLHPDGKTLYFCSDGHYGLGKLDMFKSTRLNENSWTEWSEPINLGKEINSIEDDWCYKIATRGDSAYFSAYDRKDGFGASDLYSITLPAQARPDTVVTIHGKVTDTAGQLLEAAIKWEDLTTRLNVGQLKSNPQNGEYFIVLPLGKNYGYYADKPGYYPTSKNIDLQNRPGAIDITEDIVLVAIAEIENKPGVVVQFHNVFFDFNQDTLKQESYSELNRLAQILQENPQMELEIAGHTDDIGSDAYNQNLSERRAAAVVRYLLSQDIAETRLRAKGYGKRVPIDTTGTDVGRAKNRRVEFSK